MQRMKRINFTATTPLTLTGQITFLGALLIILGWHLEVRGFVSPLGAGVSRYNTGLMFLLLGLSLVSLNADTLLKRMTLWLTTITLLSFSFATLSQYLFDRHSGIDELFFQDWLPDREGTSPGRPSPATSLCFFALGVALLIRNILRIDKGGELVLPFTSGAKSWSDRLVNWGLAVYASLLVATACIASVTFFVWITGSSETLLGWLSSGQSLLSSLLFLIASSGLIINLLQITGVETRLLWMPQSVFVAFLTLGLVIANNTHDNRLRYFQLQEMSHLALIKKLTFSAIDDAITNLSSLSWYIGDPLLYNRNFDKQYAKGLVGVVLEKQRSLVEEYGEAINIELPDCTLAPYQIQWVQDRLLISVQAASGNPAKDICIHGLFDRDFFIRQPWLGIDLKFDTRIKPAIPVLDSSRRAMDASDEKHKLLIIAGRVFKMDISPSMATRKMFKRDSRAFIITISLLFSFIAAAAVRMLLKSRLHFNAMSAANDRLISLEQRNRKVLEMAPEAVILVDDKGTIIFANQRSYEIFGVSADQLLGRSVDSLLPTSLRDKHQVLRKGYSDKPVTREMGRNLALEAIHADGHAFPVDIVLSPIEYDEDTVVMAIIRDISDKQAEKQRIERDLHEKEVLLKEVYHRVKNNMQVIASLLKMQARSAEHHQTQNSLYEASLRISALALVHEKLYQSANLSRASMRSYIESLTDTLRQSYLGSDPLKIEIEACDGEFEPEVIVPLGLILNELISNALKHAFNGTASREYALIRIGFLSEQETGSYRLTVSDNGCGIADIPSLEKSKSLGLKLIRSLTAQLKSKLMIESDENGSRFCILIPSSSLEPAASPLNTSGIADQLSKRNHEKE